MNLLNYTSHLIYAAGNTKNLPDILTRFRILCPEYSSCAEEKKPWPREDNENLFALLWNLHDGDPGKRLLPLRNIISPLPGRRCTPMNIWSFSTL